MRSAQGRTTLHVVWLSTVPFRIDSRGSQPPAQASHFSPGAVELQGVAPAWRRATSVRVSASISASVFTPAAAAPRAWHVGAFAVQCPACVHAQHKEGCGLGLECGRHRSAHGGQSQTGMDTPMYSAGTYNAVWPCPERVAKYNLNSIRTRWYYGCCVLVQERDTSEQQVLSTDFVNWVPVKEGDAASVVHTSAWIRCGCLLPTREDTGGCAPPSWRRGRCTPSVSLT